MKKIMSMVEAIERVQDGNAWEILMSISKIRARRVANELGLDIPARVWRMRKGESIAAMIEAMNVSKCDPLEAQKSAIENIRGKIGAPFLPDEYTIKANIWKKYGKERVYVDVIFTSGATFKLGYVEDGRFIMECKKLHAMILGRIYDQVKAAI